MGEHALDLLRLEPVPETGRDADGRVLRRPAGRERVRDRGVHDRDPRLRQIGHRAESLDHLVQCGGIRGAHDLRAGGRERELVRGVVLEEGETDDDDQQRHEADVQELEENDGENDVEQAEQACREQHPQCEAGIPAI